MVGVPDVKLLTHEVRFHGLGAGSHRVTVTASDRAGNSASLSVDFTAEAPASLGSWPVAGGALGVLLAVVATLLARRRCRPADAVVGIPSEGAER
jgi:hypothetical protein